jgi:LysR family glycine cleavage system transcriptional activator
VEDCGAESAHLCKAVSEEARAECRSRGRGGAAAVPGLEFADEIACDLLFPSIQAAIDGLGLVMGRTAVVSADLASGLLVEPFSIRLPSGASYHVVSPVERADMPMVKVFRDWVMSRLQAS